MDYEEKYKQALERASKLRVQNPFDTVGQMVEHIFPELAESEDEKIREEIVDFITSSNKYGTNERCEAWLNWLEKQGKQTADKVEPKFKVGDWVIDNIGDIYQIEKATEIESEHIFGYTVVGGGYFNDNNNGVRLWTIQDTKDGDVLVDEDNNIGIFSGEKDDLYWHSCIYLGCDGYLRGSMGYHKHENTKPATKEQWELLFQKMKEAGYEWKPEEKKLIKMKETKFKVGDWIVTDDSFGKIVRHVDEISSNIIDERYGVSDEYGLTYDISFDKEHKWHKWTVNDANDGDVLVSGDVIFIFNNIHGVWVRCHCALCKDGSFKDRNYDLMYAKDSKEVYPATKEQRDLLFTKMKEAGYEWDADKKELSKQILKITPKFCVGQVITDDNGTWYKITKIKCLDDWHYELYDVGKATTHLELCSIIDEKFRENRFVGEIKKMMRY